MNQWPYTYQAAKKVRMILSARTKYKWTTIKEVELEVGDKIDVMSIDPDYFPAGPDEFAMLAAETTRVLLTLCEYDKPKQFSNLIRATVPAGQKLGVLTTRRT